MAIKRININPFKLRYVLLLCILLLLPSLYSHAANNTPYRPDIFKTIKSLAPDKRVEAARNLYKANCRKMNRHDATKCLDELTQIAKQFNDRPLECAVYDMRADYYSVNNGYNALSTEHYDQAIAFAQKEGMVLETGIYQHRKAIYYFVYKLNVPACKYFLLSEETFKNIGFEKVPGISTFFLETADFYYALGDFEDTRYNLNYALKYLPANDHNRIKILNSIGLTYRNASQFDVSIKYFNQALQISRARGDSTWIVIVRGNIGSVYFMQHQYAKAIPLMQADYRGSIRYNQILNAATALLRLVKINIDENDLKDAGLQLDTANMLLLSIKTDVLTKRAKYFELRTLLNEKLGKPQLAALYRNKFDHLRDSLAQRDNIAAIERVKLQWGMDKNRAEIKRLRTIAETDAFKQDAIIVVLLLLIIITILIYNRQRLKAEKDKELLASEKRRVDEELKNATLVLHGYTENLMQKNILIEDFKTEVEKLQIKFNDADGAEHLEKMMQAHIMTEEKWNDFKKLFNRVHTTFFYNLRNQYPHLSGTDVRLLALIKLRLNNREMAGMMGITIDGVKKSKQRLRKKMDLPFDAEIEAIILPL